MFKELLGIGLSSKISYFISKYRDDLYAFDGDHIVLRVGREGNKFHVGAYTYCNSPYEGGYDMSDTVWIYHSRGFKSVEEAMAHLVREVRTAQNAHPYTKFYRIVGDSKVASYEEYSNGKWEESDWDGWA